MSSAWQAFEEADVDARKGHARRIDAIVGLLEIYPAVSLGGLISTRSQVLPKTARGWVREAVELRERRDLAEASRDGLLSHDQITQLRKLAKPGEDGVWVETLGCPFSCEEFQITKLERLARCETARKLERTDGGCFLKMDSTPDERFVDGQFRLPPEDGAVLENELDARIPQDTPLHRLAAAHAKALMELVADGRSRRVNGSGPAAGLKATVVVRSEQAVLDGVSDQPGELANGNLVPAGVVRDLADTGNVFVLDLDGVDLNTDEIPAPVRRWVWYRDEGRCRLPDCATPTLRLQIHHLTYEGAVGKHHPRYLALCCWACHQVRIHRQGWRVVGDAEAKLTWLRPDGSVYTPPPLTKRARAPDTTT